MSESIAYPLSNGGEAIIDIEDYEKVSAFGKWYMNDSGYAVKKTKIQGKNISIRMHALINNTPKGLHTDHINGDRLDNRKSNLRTATAAMNAWNQTKPAQGTKYDLPKGITYDIQRKKYVARKVMFKRFNSLEQAIKYMEGENREWK